MMFTAYQNPAINSKERPSPKCCNSSGQLPFTTQSLMENFYFAFHTLLSGQQIVNFNLYFK